MQIIVSILLDLKLVNVQNPRSVAYMQGGITSEFFFFFLKKIFHEKFRIY